jgi:hypothetical protein
MSESYPACDKTRDKLLALGYKQKKVNERYLKGQKYYQITRSVPNCVRSFVCNNDNTVDPNITSKGYNDNCKTNKYTYKDSNGKMDEKEPRFGPDWPIVQEEDTKNGSIYYRTCPMFGCPKGTSAIDVIDSSGGRRRTYKKSRRFRRTRK